MKYIFQINKKQLLYFKFSAIIIKQLQKSYVSHKYYQYAGVAQLVERCLAKAKVAGSNPVFRSILILKKENFFYTN